MGHKWVYLGEDRYRCDKCGLEATREEITAGVADCKREAVEKRLDRIETKLMADLDAIEARLNNIEGVTT